MTKIPKVISDMMSEINDLNNALIHTYAILSGGNTEDVFRKVLDKEDFKVLTVAKAEEVVRTITDGSIKKETNEY
jgi:hypothetical protein